MEPHPLEFLFHPRSVAVAGVSPDVSNQAHDYFVVLQRFGFPGPVYAVNPNYTEIEGIPCYRSLRDIPGPVDYVVSCVPASALLSLLDDATRVRMRSDA